MTWGCVHAWQIIAKTFDPQGETTSFLLECSKCGGLETKILYGQEISNVP